MNAANPANMNTHSKALSTKAESVNVLLRPHEGRQQLFQKLTNSIVLSLENDVIPNL